MSKFNKFIKTVAVPVVSVAAIASVAGLIVYKTTNKFKPVFFNYQSYIDPKIQERLNQDFEYKEFGTINEFTRAILTHKSVAGIGSDAQAARLVKGGDGFGSRLRKFTQKDFKNMFGENWDTSLTTEENLQNLLTPTVFNHLKSYDNYLKDSPEYDENGNPLKDENGKIITVQKHLYEYFIPYFQQDMVIAYNPLKLEKYAKTYKYDYNSNESFDETLEQSVQNENYSNAVRPFFDAMHKEIETNVNKALYEAFSKSKDETISMLDALQIIKNQGLEYFEYTDAVRDNMIYGSSYTLNSETNEIESQPTGEARSDKDDTKPLYERLIQQFVDLFKRGTSFDITNTKHVRTSGNGQDLLNTLIDPTKNTNVGIIYNGDALDALISRDNVEGSKVPDGTVKFIRPSVNILLIDGLVITNDASDEVVEQVITSAKESYMGGLDKSKDKWNQDNVDNIVSKNNDTEGYTSEVYSAYGSYLNFDYVRYTPAFNLVFDYAYNHAFNDPLDEKADQYFNDYLVNYQRNLFSIKDKYTIGHKYDSNNPEDTYFKEWKEITYNVKHVAISPVDQTTQALINAYYDKLLKN